jgi:predicted metal-dependent hydrolase
MQNAFAEGVIFFNAGKYFDAHETWEDLWRLTEKGPLKDCYQGLIQAAVALHHLQHGNLAGSRSQLDKSIERLARSGSAVSAIDVEDLIRQLRKLRDGMTPEKVQIRAAKLW